MQPIWHVIVLNLLTTCLYAPFWFFKNYKDLRRRATDSPDKNYALHELSVNEAAALQLFKRIHPFFLTILSVVPLVGPVVIAFFFKNAAQLYPDTNSIVRKHSIVAGVLLASLLVGTLCLGRLPGSLYFLYISAVIPMSICQHWLNRYWKSVEPNGLLTRQSFSSIELVLLIFGISLVGMHIVQEFFIGK